MTIYPEESLHWFPPDYWVEQSDILLVLRRREGSVTPGPAVLGMLWLLGIIPMDLCAAALYSLRAML